MQVRDALRSQYYLPELSEALDRFSCGLQQLTSLTILPQVMDTISTHIALLLDDLILPTVTHEVAVAHARNELRGDTAQSRYRSFFLSQLGWTKRASSLFRRYPLLRRLIRTLVESSFLPLQEMFERISQDRSLIETELGDGKLLSIVDIEYVDSDRHNHGRQAIIVQWGEGLKIVYKPTSLESDIVFQSCQYSLNGFMDRAVSKPYKIVSRDGYGYMEYVKPQQCQTAEEVASFFFNSGSLLCLAYHFQYSDGHASNMIARGVFPTLIDLETAFTHPLYLSGTKARDTIFRTGLLQREYGEEVVSSALQAGGDYRHQILSPHPLHERTDTIRVSFQKTIMQPTHNLVMLDGKRCQIYDHADAFIQGYQEAFQAIMIHRGVFLRDDEFWTRLALCKSREIVRPTIQYLWFISQLSQPRHLNTRRHPALSKLRQDLNSKFHVPYDSGLDRLSESEWQQLNRLDVPYFYSNVGGNSLWDKDGHVWQRFFEKSSLANIRDGLAGMTAHRLDQQLNMITSTLNAAPKEA